MNSSIRELITQLKEQPEPISSRTYPLSKTYQLDKQLRQFNYFVLYLLEFIDKNNKRRAYTGFTNGLQSRTSGHASAIFSKKANKHMLEAFQLSGSLPTVKVLMVSRDKEKILEAETKAVGKLEQLEFEGVIVKCINISKRQYEYTVDTTPFDDASADERRR